MSKRAVLTTLILLSALSVCGTGCDLVTEAPDFSVRPDFEAPLISSQSFVLLGPDTTDRTPLIDTTRGGSDSLFSVRPGDQSVVLAKEVALFQDRSLSRLLPSLDAGPASLSVQPRQFLPRQVGGRFGDSVGVRTRPEVETPFLPVEHHQGSIYAVAPDAMPVPPNGELLETPAEAVKAFTLSAATGDVNQYQFIVRNGLQSPLISADRAGAAPPELVLETPAGEELARTDFPDIVQPGDVARTRLNVARKRLPRPLRFRVDATTPEGIAPILTQPQAVRVATRASRFRIVETTLRGIPEQPPTRLSLPTTSIEGGSGVHGLVVREGTASLTIQNSLPYPINITELGLRNERAVGSFPAGTRPFQMGPIRVPSRSTRTVEVDVGRTAFSTRFSPQVEVAGEGTNSPVSVRAEDGVQVQMDLTFELETLYMRPAGQQARAQGRIPIRSEAIRFDAPDDHVTLDRGRLTFGRLENGFPSGLDPFRVDFPSFLRPPYDASNPLVVQFGGNWGGSSSRQFPAIPAEGSLQDQHLDLSGIRFELPGTTVPIRGSVRLSPQAEVEGFHVEDEVSAAMDLGDLGVQGLQADVAPLSTFLPPDADDDGRVDIADDAESQVLDASAFHQIGGTTVTALDLEDTRIRLSLSTNIGAEIALYFAVLGRRSNGDEVFLGGRGSYAVSEEDTTARVLRRNGEPISPDNLLRIPLSGASSPDETVTRVIELGPSTATVPAFLRLLPEEIRIVGRLVVQPEGGRVQFRKPVTFGMQFGLAQPFRVGGDVALTQTVDANLSGLESLTTSTGEVSLEKTGLNVPYENEFPLSTSIRLEVLDGQGAVIERVPAADSDSLRLQAAPVSSTGVSDGTRSGTIRVEQSKTRLERMSQGESLRLHVELNSPPDGDAVVRATDGFSLRLEGAAGLEVGGSN